MRRGALLLCLAVLLPSPAATAQTVTPACPHTYAPFSTVPNASVSAVDFVSKDDPPVRYTMYRGIVPSFDGLPMSVDVTVPCGTAGPLPFVSMNHGWTDDKTIWEETGRSDTVDSPNFRPGSNAHWNNIWFASRGYAVLTYTARGWHDSCGPGTPGAIANVAPAPQCLPYEYWIHADDMRWEIRDTQWLTAALVDSGVADPARLAITGGSYGGGQTTMNALLRDRTMCGGARQAYGIDPCALHADGDLVPWTTANGGRHLHWTVAVPLYTWSDEIQALLPNGRGSDGGDVPDGSHFSPIGVPIESYLAGIYAAGQPLSNGFYAPPGDESDVTVTTLRTLAGNPFPAQDPLAAEGIRMALDRRSPINIPPDGIIPIFWTQGLTDALFTANEALQMTNKLHAYDANYPIKLFLGDLGHDYAAERVDEWAHAHDLMNAFIDHYLFPDREPATPSMDVTATITRCLNHDDPAEYATASDWASLHPGRETFSATTGGWTSSAVIGQEGIDTDPVSGGTLTGTLPPQIAYRGCRIMTPATVDANTVAFSFPLDHTITMLGGPVVDLGYLTTANDTELNVRLWDVAADGSRQGLVTRGVYRSLDGPGDGLHARFQIAPNGYRFPAGHTMRLEVTANDAPYRQPSNVPALVNVEQATITLPTR